MTEKEISWSAFPGEKTEAVHFMKFKSWLEQAQPGDSIAYLKNARPGDLSRLFFFEAKAAAYKAFAEGQVALFQRRVHPSYPGFDYIAVKLSSRSRNLLQAVQDDLAEVQERLCA